MADAHPIERERLRAAALRMVEAFVTPDATAEQLTLWAETVERHVASLEGAPPGSVFWGIGTRNYFSVRGLLQPPGFIAPPAFAGDTLSGTLVFGDDQAGHHGFAHGGSIAQAFDFLLSSFEFAAETVTYTRELSVRFRKPIPLHHQVRLECEIRERAESSASVEGRALLDGAVHAEAAATVVYKRLN